MAALNVDAAAVAEARKSGYSDKEIVEHLAATDPSKFKEATDSGYQPKEILDHLTGADRSTGVVAGLRQGIAGLLTGGASTEKTFLGGTDSPLREKAAEAVAPKNYKPAEIVPEDGHWYDPRTYNYKQIPQAIAEAAPGMAQDITAARLGAMGGGAAGSIIPGVGTVAGGIAGGVVGGVGSYLYRTRGDSAKEAAVTRTGDAKAEPNTEDKTRSLVTGAVEAPMQAIGVGRFLPGVKQATSVGVKGVMDAAARLTKTAAIEGANGASQSAVEQAGQTIGTPGGLNVDPNKVVGAGITSAATGGLLATPRAMGDAHSVVKYRSFGGENTEASTAVANRIETAADGKNLANVKTGRTAVDAAKSEVSSELSEAVKDLKSRTELSPDATNALNRATSGKELTEKNFAHIEEAVKGDPAADSVIALARQAHVIGKLTSSSTYGSEKFMGGISGAMERTLRPIYNPTATLASTAGAALGAGALPGMIGMYAPHLVGGVYGAYAAARAVDKLTGARSPANSFVSRFADPSASVRPAAPAAPVPTPSAPVSPTGPKIPLNPGVTGAGLMRTMGQNPFAQAVPTAPAEPAGPNPQQLKLQMAALVASRKAAAMQKEAAQTAATPDPQQLLQQMSQLAAQRKAAGMQEQQQQQQSVAEATPLLQRLAAQSKPPEIPAVAPAPAVPPVIPKDALMRGKTLVSSMQKMQALKQKTIGTQQAEDLASSSPLVEAAGGLDNIANPAMGKRASQIIGAANAYKKLTAQPEAEGDTSGASVSPPPSIEKITKKAGQEKVHEKPREEASGYTPLTREQMPYVGSHDQDVATFETQKASPYDPQAYHDSIIDARRERRGAMAELAADHEHDADHMAHLLDQLHHIRRRSDAVNAVDHYARTMSPAGAAAVRARFSRPFINAHWKV